MVFSPDSLAYKLTTVGQERSIMTCQKMTLGVVGTVQHLLNMTNKMKRVSRRRIKITPRYAMNSMHGEVIRKSEQREALAIRAAL